LFQRMRTRGGGKRMDMSSSWRLDVDGGALIILFHEREKGIKVLGWRREGGEQKDRP